MSKTPVVSDVLLDEIVDLLYRTIPYMEDACKDPVYKPGYVAKLLRQIQSALAKVDYV